MGRVNTQHRLAPLTAALPSRSSAVAAAATIGAAATGAFLGRARFGGLLAPALAGAGAAAIAAAAGALLLHRTPRGDRTPDPIPSAPAPSPLPPPGPVDAANGRGYVHAGPTGRYLQRQDGSPFFAIGHGEGFGFFLDRMNSPTVQDEFLRHMHETGQNTVVVQLENELPNFFNGRPANLERPVGHYDDAIATQFDAFLERARTNDTQVITYLWDTFNMDFSWKDSPYNRVNGGPCEVVSDMLRNPEAKRLQKAKIDWFMQRYGNHPNLMALDLMNEIDWAVAGKNPANKIPGSKPTDYRLGTQSEMKAWVDEMSTYAKASYRRYWGDPATGTPGSEGLGIRQPLLTVGANNPRYIGDEDWSHRHPNLDLATNHLYSWVNRETTDPSSTGSLAAAVRSIVRGNHASVDAAKPRPYLDTEHSELGYWVDHQKMAPNARAFARAISWGELTSGAAGAGMRWPNPNQGFAGNPHLNSLTPQMEQDTLALSKVAAVVDWNRFDGKPAATEEFRAGDASAFTSAVRDEHQMVGYVARYSSDKGQQPERPTKISVAGFADEPHEVTWFSPTSGEVLHRQRVARGAAFDLESPPFSYDAAMVIRPAT